MLAVRTPALSLASLSRFATRPGTDTELLGRFVANRDEDAFAELVRRHGPTILAVCRRVTGNHDDADDAFQATFLALARKAREVRRESLGGWLYKVAVRAARKALGRSHRRRSREETVAELPDVPARQAEGPDPDEARAVLEAVAGLSDAYRAAVVLCELEGQSRAAAARELGIPEGTLSSRLGAARRVLAARLRDRGFGASLLAAVAVLAANPTLAADARRLARASAFPSQEVEKLMEVAMRTTRSRWALTTAVVVMVAGLVMATDPPTRPGPELVAAPKAVVEKADTSRLIFASREEVVVLSPQGQELRRLTRDDFAKAENAAPVMRSKGRRVPAPYGRVAPDGRVPFITHTGFQLLDIENRQLVQPVKAPNMQQALFPSQHEPHIVAWSADSRQVIGVRQNTWRFLSAQRDHILIDVQAGTFKELALPTDHRIIDWSSDGTWFLTMYHKTFPWWDVQPFSLCRVSCDGKVVTELVSGCPFPPVAALAPDGKQLVYSRPGPEKGVSNGFELVRKDLTTGATTVIVSQVRDTAPGELFVTDGAWKACWAPDGKHLTYGYCRYKQNEKDAEMTVEWRLNICRDDGSDNRTVLVRDAARVFAKSGNEDLLSLVLDWR